MRETKLIAVAQITKAQGIRGGVHVVSFCSPPENLETYVPLYTEGREIVKIIKKTRMTRAGFYTFLIEGITDRNQAETLRGKKLYVTREQLPPPDGDSYYYEDLVGMVVYDDQGIKKGLVTSVVNFGAQDTLVIQMNSGEENLIPFVRDIQVNLPQKCIVVPHQFWV